MPKREILKVLCSSNIEDELQEEHFEKGSWVFMHPAAIGPHRVRKRDVLDSHWKGRLLGFKEKKAVGIVVVVQHVYSISDIYLPPQNCRTFPINYIFPSTMIEEQPIQCLSRKFMAFHEAIGNTMFSQQRAFELAQSRIFFFSHTYVIPMQDGAYGKLQSIEAPSLNSVEWPKPDDWTTIAIKQKIVVDIRASLKFGKASSSVGLSWCCLIHVFVYVFCTLPFAEAPTMYICKDVPHSSLDNLLGDRWGNIEGFHNGDIFKCNVAHSGIGLRYLKSQTSLYMPFHYERWMSKRGKWIPLQVSEEVVVPIDITVTMSNGFFENVRANKHWSLASVRDHLIILGAENAQNGSFKLKHRKIGRRKESTTMVQESWSAEDLLLS